MVQISGCRHSVGLHPSEGQTNLDYAGRGGTTPGPNYTLNKSTGYSWIKSPRWYNKPMEVGLLAHVVMMYAKVKSTSVTDAEKAHKRAQDLVDAIWVGQLGLKINDIDSTLSRIVARTIETSVIADAISRWHVKLLDNITAGNLATFVTDANVVAQNPSLKGFKWTDTSTWNNGNPLQVGVSFTVAPRGALGHWLSIFGGKIQNYQLYRCQPVEHWT